MNTARMSSWSPSLTCTGQYIHCIHAFISQFCLRNLAQALKKQEEEKEAKKRQKLGGADAKPEAKEGESDATAAGAATATGESKDGDAMDVDLLSDEELWANYELTGVLTHQVCVCVCVCLCVCPCV